MEGFIELLWLFTYCTVGAIIPKRVRKNLKKLPDIIQEILLFVYIIFCLCLAGVILFFIVVLFYKLTGYVPD